MVKETALVYIKLKQYKQSSSWEQLFVKASEGSGADKSINKFIYEKSFFAPLHIPRLCLNKC